MTNLINILDNRMNPIVVKELRQGLQSWFIIIIVNLLLVALSLTCILMVMTNPEITEEATGGRDMFLFLQAVLFIASVMCVPLYVLSRLRAERNGINVDLFFTTTLKPHKIVRGKFVAGMSLVTLLYSVCLPFILFTYVLRGYDIPSMLFSLAIGYFASIPIMMAAIVIGTWTMPRMFSPFVMLAALVALGLVVSGLCTLCYGFLHEGFQNVFRSEESIVVVGFILLIGFLLVKLLEAMAIGLLSPPSSNRTCRLRTWMTISIFSLAAGFAAFGGSMLMVSTHGPSNWVEAVVPMTFVWSLISMGLVTIMVLIAMCEPDGFSNRIMIQRPRWFVMRLILFPFTHGTSTGLFWATIHVTVVLGCLYGLLFVLENFFMTSLGGVRSELNDINYIMPWVIIVFSSIVAYALLARIIMRTFFRRVPVKHTWVTFLFVFMVLSVSSMVICFAIDPHHWDDMLFWKVFNPMAESLDHEVADRAYIDAFWALCMLVLCIPPGLRDVKRYLFDKQAPPRETLKSE